MRLFATAVRMQLRLARSSPDTFLVCLTAPLLTVVFLAVSDSAGRTDLSPYAVVAPTLMSLWMLSLFTAGELISEERYLGTLEGLVAAPASMGVVVLGRLCAVTAIGLAPTRLAPKLAATKSSSTAMPPRTPTSTSVFNPACRYPSA